MTYRKKLIVVKVGTNVLTNLSEGKDQLNENSFSSIGKQVKELASKGYGMIIVSSGAITAGVMADRLRRDTVSSTIEEGRFAARGWDIIVQKWKLAIGSSKVSSTLLTKREVLNPALQQRLIDIVDCCISHGDVCIVNENDCLSDSEIRFGDNDTLAATLASACAQSGKFAAVDLVLLTNVDGLLASPSEPSTVIRRVIDIGTVEKYAAGATSVHSRGGMTSKLHAAAIAKQSSVRTCIANGAVPDVIAKALSGEVGTMFTL